MSFESEILKQLGSLADVIDEVDETVTYQGFFKPGKSDYSVACCRIVEIRKDGTITTVKYPNGVDDYAHIWNNRAELDYLHKI